MPGKFRETDLQIEHMLLLLRAPSVTVDGLPTNQQRLHIVFGIERGENFRRLRDVVQISAKIAAA